MCWKQWDGVLLLRTGTLVVVVQALLAICGCESDIAHVACAGARTRPPRRQPWGSRSAACKCFATARAATGAPASGGARRCRSSWLTRLCFPSPTTVRMLLACVHKKCACKTSWDAVSARVASMWRHVPSVAPCGVTDVAWHQHSLEGVWGCVCSVS